MLPIIFVPGAGQTSTVGDLLGLNLTYVESLIPMLELPQHTR